jgi:hypothetical protein
MRAAGRRSSANRRWGEFCLFAPGASTQPERHDASHETDTQEYNGGSPPAQATNTTAPTEEDLSIPTFLRRNPDGTADGNAAAPPEATDTTASTETSGTNAAPEETGTETPPEGTKTETTTKRWRQRKGRFQYQSAPPQAATGATAPRVNYTVKDLIDEGKALRAKADKLDGEQDDIQDRLGEIAHEIVCEQKWGNKLKLTTYAKAIGYDSCAVLRRYMSVHRAYRDIPWREFRPEGLIPYGVRRALQAHEDREAILRTNPNITLKEARNEMRDYNKKKNGGDDEDNERDKGNTDWDKHTAGWYRDFIDKCTKCRGAIIDVKAVPPENKRPLLNVEFDLLSVPEELGQALLKFVVDMRQLRTQEQEWEQAAEDPPTPSRAEPPPGKPDEPSKKKPSKKKQAEAAVLKAVAEEAGLSVDKARAAVRVFKQHKQQSRQTRRSAA